LIAASVDNVVPVFNQSLLEFIGILDTIRLIRCYTTSQTRQANGVRSGLLKMADPERSNLLTFLFILTRISHVFLQIVQQQTLTCWC